MWQKDIRSLHYGKLFKWGLKTTDVICGEGFFSIEDWISVAYVYKCEYNFGVFIDVRPTSATSQMFTILVRSGLKMRKSLYWRVMASNRQKLEEWWGKIWLFEPFFLKSSFVLRSKTLLTCPNTIWMIFCIHKVRNGSI